MRSVIFCVGLLFLVGVKDIPYTIAQEPYRSPFRYLIVWRYVELEQRTQIGYRNLAVLLDERAFSEANLTELFRLPKKRFPVPQGLFVDVRVSLEHLTTPEEEDETQISDRSDVLPGTQPAALLARNGLGEEWISYTIDPSKYDKKMIVLKGRSGQPPK